MNPPSLAAQWFDGRSPAARTVTVRMEGAELCVDDAATGAALTRAVAARVRWSERQRHGQRQAELPDGTLLTAIDSGAWDAWRRASGPRDSAVVRAMQSWRGAVFAMVITAVVVGAAWRWGIPWAADRVALAMPLSASTALGDEALAQIDARWLHPSQLPAAQQQSIAQRLARAVAAAYPRGGAPHYTLHWRRANDAIGPNAFALPGGHIIVTDQLVALLQQPAPDAIVGVLAHELGHVAQQHGLRLATRTAAAGALASLAFGDVTWLFTAAPALLMQMDYSRAFEHEADIHARKLMRAAGLRTSDMAWFFDRLAQREVKGDEVALPIGFSSHPPNAERRAFFESPDGD